MGTSWQTSSASASLEDKGAQVRTPAAVLQAPADADAESAAAGSAAAGSRAAEGQEVAQRPGNCDCSSDATWKLGARPLPKSAATYLTEHKDEATSESMFTPYACDP